jgi:hypothetical protein
VQQQLQLLLLLVQQRQACRLASSALSRQPDWPADSPFSIAAEARRAAEAALRPLVRNTFSIPNRTTERRRIRRLFALLFP